MQEIEKVGGMRVFKHERIFSERGKERKEEKGKKELLSDRWFFSIKPV